MTATLQPYNNTERPGEMLVSNDRPLIEGRDPRHTFGGLPTIPMRVYFTKSYGSTAPNGQTGLRSLI